MEIYNIQKLNFTYPDENKEALKNINLQISSGEFITLCGKSGSGKTTLLRQLKTVIAPAGNLSGNIRFMGKYLADVNLRNQSGSIGYVMQNADNQVVTDKVWHELAFGLESLGYDNNAIRTKVAETAAYFGITSWFNKNVNELSGGQKQILALAGVLAMMPKIIILDEPTSKLDPIATTEFINLLRKINTELGITIIISEHRIDELVPISDRMLVMEEGCIICDGKPQDVCKYLKNSNQGIFKSMPVTVRIWAAVKDSDGNCPLTVADGRKWLNRYVDEHEFEYVNEKKKQSHNISVTDDYAVSVRNVSYKYDKNTDFIIENLNLNVYKGEIFTILGGNGAGKSTLLSLIAGVTKSQSGKININGRLAMMPQNPETLFVKKTVLEDLHEIEKNDKDVNEIIKVCHIEQLINRHPYDLSGGEKQRTALAKVLLTKADILLFDEPTKGIDNEYKEIFADILLHLKKQKKTIILVSHDIEFCAMYSDRCGMLFGGEIISVNSVHEFFANNRFYTTITVKISAGIIDGMVTYDDIVNSCNSKKIIITNSNNSIGDENKTQDISNHCINIPDFDEQETKTLKAKGNEYNTYEKTRNKKYYLITLFIIMVLIPVTIYTGAFMMDDRKYLFISLLIMFECFIPFSMLFEKKSPQAREIVMLAVMCAMAVAGRIAFYMLPQFKPVMAMVIISGVAFGSEAGFLVGALTMLVSNMVFVQGPWTPWQMFAMGIIGFLAGLLFSEKTFGRNKYILCVFGFICAIVLYGGIMNLSAAVTAHIALNKKVILSYYAAGLPMDIVHGVATAIFLFFLSKPMSEKIKRIRIKYGF